MKFWQKSKREQFFNELYEKYKDVMYRIAFKVVKNDADAQDAVQNAMMCVLKKMNELPSQDHDSLQRAGIRGCSSINSDSFF